MSKVAKLSIELRRNYEDKLTNSLNSPKSIRTFFNYAKHQRLDNHKIISLLGDNGEMVSEANSASILSEYFASVFSQPVERGTYIRPTVNKIDNNLDEIAITEVMVLQQLELLNEAKSPGPDNIHPKLLRKFSKYFYTLYILFLFKILSLESYPVLETGKYSTYL